MPCPAATILAALLAASASAGPLEDASALEGQGKLAEARGRYEAILQANPGDRAAALRLVHVLVSLEALTEAEAKLQPLLAAPNGSDAVALNELGRLRFRQDRQPEALKAFKAAAGKDPSFVDAAYNLGIAFQEAGQVDAARASYRRVLVLDPKFLRAYNALGALEARGKHYDEALRLLTEAERIAPDDFDTLYNLGNVVGEMDRLEDSARYFAKAVERKPNSPEGRNNYGRALVRLKKFAEAEIQLQEAVRLKPDQPESQFNLGVLREETRHPAEAEAAYRRTLEISPRFAEAAFRLGNICLGKAQDASAKKDAAGTAAHMEEARGWYEKAVAANAEYSEALYNLTLTLIQLKRLDAAETRARTLVRLAPAYAPNQFLLGTVESQLGKAVEAERAFRAAVRLDPKCMDCALRLGSLLYQTGKFDEAVAPLRRASAADDKNIEAHYLLGLVLMRQGELASARREMEAVVRLKPDHLDAINNAATIAVRMRQFKDAAFLVGRMIDLDPSYLAAFRTAETLYAQTSDLQISGSPVTVKLLTRYIVGNRAFFKSYKDAHAAFAEMVRLEAKCAAAHLKLGVLDVLNGKYQEGLGHLDDAERLLPGDGELYFAVGSAYYSLGEKDSRGQRSPHFRSSLDAYRKAVRVSPSYADAYWGEGSALFQMGRYDESRKVLEICLKLNPFFAEAYNTLGSVLERQGELATDPAKQAALREEAIRAYQQSLRANPNAEAAHYNLAIVYHQLKRWKEAKAEYEAATRLNPKFTRGWYQLGRLYIDRNGWFDRGRAEQAMKKALEIEPGNCDYWYDLGALYFNTRQYEKSKEAWRRTLELCPNNKPARDGIERLIERGY